MNSTQGMNLAPAFCAATVAVVALGISLPYYGYWQFVLCVALIATASAAVAGAIAIDRFGIVALSAALSGIVMCVNGALFFSVGLTLLGKEIVIIVLFTFLCIVSIGLAGLASIGATGACRRWLPGANPAFIIAAVILANSLIIVAVSAAGRVIDDLGEAIFYGIGQASVAAFCACVVAVIVSLVSVPVATWCRNSSIDHGIFLITIGASWCQRTN